jgi:hypothetical protein
LNPEQTPGFRELMMAGFGHGTRRYPRSRGRTRSRTGPDRATLGIIGVVCGVAGLFVLGIVLGPAAIICGWLSMGRRWARSSPLPALIAVVLGVIDTLLAVIWLAGATAPGNGLF